jgi:hypothetical protein
MQPLTSLRSRTSGGATWAAHGYVVVDVGDERLRAEWWHVDTVLPPSAGVSLAAAFVFQPGQPGLRAA